ncbi:hypothetical protein [Gymnodinialimonas ceratoperidinii]|uniref:Uncharacterized protein n=1 Tax=Gymnodinialimonas ceratoperidinii TaxID=2856823 RepID=A0A8F6TXX6_9RHOB|nr:hypothetical protein [Gymnodinialimonas ceratoperidinii]QXT40498.1 hypothetical protein KYE46_04435 [Gymnodinialimonas ceratoperidinii]
MSRVWRITKDDPADLGFATSACTYEAVTMAEFRAWAERVVMTTPDADLPSYMIDYMTGPSIESGAFKHRTTGPGGFTPYDPLLDKRAHAKALTGIGHRRGVVQQPEADAWVSKEDALDALEAHPVVADRFLEVFDTLQIGAAQ